MGLGLGGRVRVEGGDCAWILSVHSSFLEARVQETLVSLTWGIPTALFSTEKRLRTQEVHTPYLERLWRQVGDNTKRAKECLAFFDREYEFPFYERGDGRAAQHFGRYTSIVYACNVLPDVMSMRTFDGYADRRAGAWYPVSVTREFYDGTVHSLEVENAESESPGRRLYVSDGIVTHNSIYAFRGSFTDSMDRMKNTADAYELPLSVNDRSRQAIVDFVNREILDSTMIAHKDGGEVVGTMKQDLVQEIIKHDVKMIVGARNKSLLECWITLAKAKISSTLKGSGIVKEIRDIIKDLKPESITMLLEKLQEAIEKAVVVNADGEATYTIPESLYELMTAIPEIIETYDIISLDALQDILSEMEQDAVREIHTVHSAKGLEAPVH
jgi:hypothetical protein